jgi:kynurenine formamidase
VQDATGNWGRWGADDERGALNLATPATVLQAAHATSTGKAYSLAIPIGRRATPDIAGRPAPERLTLSGPGDEGWHQQFGAADGVGANEDLLVVASHAGTHMDALCHVYEGSRLYNGYDATTFTPRSGASRLGIEKTGTIAARGVLLDVAGHLGVDHLEAGHVVTGAELEACAATQQTPVQAGDALLVRTGWLEGHLGPTKLALYPQPGLGLDAAEFAADCDVALVGADNAAVEVLPFDDEVYLGVHIALLVKRGITFVEHLWLADLAKDRCHRFLLVIGGLPVTGATGSPVNPIALG